jgi:glycosyltransferase involved in cell wall biosynthesis
MAKFFFTQLQNVEMVVKSGKPWGGSVVQTFNWMQALNELNQEVLLAKHIDDNRELLEKYNWLKMVSFYDSKKYRGKAVWFSYRFPSIFRVFRLAKPDFVYTSIASWRTLYFCMICKILGIKHIIRIANDPDVDKSILESYPKIYELQINLAFRMTDFILAQNNFQYNILRNKYPKTNILKISNPIVLNQDFLKPKKNNNGYIAWLANFRHQKNLALLYELARSLADETFKIAGEPLYPLDAETATYFDKLKTLANVEFVGVVPRNLVLSFLHEAKFLLSTSRYEGFSNTFLESMVVGTPILTTPKVNPDGIIDEHDLGYIYTDAKGLFGILENMDLSGYLEKSNNCVSYVKEYHGHIQLGKKLLNFLNVPLNKK